MTAASDQTIRLRGGGFDLLHAQRREVVLSGPAGTGKAQPLDAVVWTPTGPRRMGDICVGDVVCHPSGGTSRVLAVHPQGEQPVYRLTFSCDEVVECTEDHLWTVHYIGGGKRNGSRRREITVTRSVRDLINDYLIGNRRRPKYWIPQTQPVHFAERPVPIDPYVLGVLLGDGCLLNNTAAFSSADEQLVEEVRRRLGDRYRLCFDGKFGYRISASGNWVVRKSRGKPGFIRMNKVGKPFCVTLRQPGGRWEYGGTYRTREEAEAAIREHELFAFSADERTGVGIWSDLRALGLYGLGSEDKFVPDEYLVNGVEVRLEVLRGLMDTDGTVDRKTGMPSFTSISRSLAEDVLWLVESLGGTGVITTKQPPNGQLAYTCHVRLNDNASLFRLDRKKSIAKRRTKYPVKRMLLSIDSAGVKPCQCITVDEPDGLYLTDRFVVTHNSVACLFKLHFLCRRVPGIRCLMLRKTRTSLTESGLVTFENKVIGPNHPLTHTGGTRRNRRSYDYPNGSTIVVGGMDQPSKVMSTDYDLVYVQEAIELEEEDWEALLSRMRHHVLPYQQLFADTNPDTPGHWIKQREADGKLLLIESQHEDNPLFHTGKKWTKQGLEYLASLDQLTGPRFQRLRHGKWVQAEGAVYDSFSRAVHVVDMTLPPLDWPRYLSIDFGFTNAFVCLWGAVDPDGRLWIYRQWVRTQRLVEDHAKVILREIEGEVRIQRNNLVRSRREKEREMGEDAAARWLHENMQGAPGLVRPKAIICDHDAEDRATLQKHLGMATVPAPKSISPGIQAVQSRLRVQADGKPRLLIGRNSVIERDPGMAAAKLPIGVAEEMEGYVWDTRNGRGRGEEPLGVNDHVLDALRYLVAYLDAPRREARVW